MAWDRFFESIGKNYPKYRPFLFGVTIAFYAFAAYYLIMSRQELPEVSPELIQVQAQEIEDALSNIDGIIANVNSLSERAIEAEQRAADAEALLQLSERELDALDRRLRQGETTRNFFWASIGALIGIGLDKGLKLINILWQKRKQPKAPNNPSTS